ncbi:MAG: ATPase, T2SS/T4P/T4SS family [Candidatus Micrarchaeota archaeon]|nr:ATPase, T2SS/T4P/T4SS family [Candidatus Micrarchaeota archaeon]
MKRKKPKAAIQEKSPAPLSRQPKEAYTLRDGELEARISIFKKQGEHVLTYELSAPKWEPGTEAFMEDAKPELLKKVSISSQEALNIKMTDELRMRFFEEGKKMIRENLPQLSEEKAETMARKLVQEMLGLGEIEFMLKDDMIEEICVNSSSQPIWAYHRKYGWMKTNLRIPSEAEIWNYSSSIARGVGRQINTRTPLLDAYLPTGDRVNATLSPISYYGNTITIRKFARKPWTITDYVRTGTISSELAAILWLSIQYELNMIISGGTGAGKTSMLNVLSMFIPQNQRVVSIEQTKELTLDPDYFQWVPLVVREPTSEGTGGISMLDLMVNSLRMRPDRILVGEIRRAEEAQVLFEAMHTGHSVYATLHAETVSETVRRLANPPLSIPPVMMESLHLVLAMYRDRRSNIRRVFELGEIIPTEREGIAQNIIYRWRPYKDSIVPAEPSARLFETIKQYTNMDDAEIKRDLDEKKKVIDWLCEKGIDTVKEVGEIIAAYYDEPQELRARMKR